MNLNKIVYISLLFFSFNVSSQMRVDLLEYKHRIQFSEKYFTIEDNCHTSILPLIFESESAFEKAPGQLTIHPVEKNNKNISARLYPITDLMGGLESGTIQASPFRYTAGIGIGTEFSSNTWYTSLKFLPYVSEPIFTFDSVRQNFGIDVGTTRPITGSIFQRSEFIVAYKPHRIFTLSTGYGKNFFGEGYRSVFLSDHAAPYPFLKVQTSFGSIQYVNLYAIWKDNSALPSDRSMDKMKFSSSHYLSWNIIPGLNIGVFETVVWQAKDSLAQRNFDFNYLNPVVFFRPVEYGLGSADNVLLGAALNYKPDQHHSFYSQLLLDEFLLSELKAGNNWWGNKYAIQVGYKSNQFFVENLFLQLEFNMVRPFTYAHKYAVQSYGHYNSAVAHPAGANFYELVNIVSYRKEKFMFTNKITYLGIGVDKDSINQGQNIFRSYSDRNGNYGHKIMQGNRMTIFNEQFIAEYPLLNKIDLYVTAMYQYRMSWSSAEILHQHFLTLGIRTRLWNSYADY